VVASHRPARADIGATVARRLSPRVSCAREPARRARRDAHRDAIESARDAATHLRDDERDREHERFAPTHRTQRQRLPRGSLKTADEERSQDTRPSLSVLRFGSKGEVCVMNALLRIVSPIALFSSLLMGSACGGNAVGIGSGGSDAGAPSDGALQRACTPGQQVACACPGVASTGAQTCELDGQSFGACIGCPSSTDASGGSSDGALDHDATGVGTTHPSGQGFDGTTGLPCATSADCRGARGPGINACSNGLTYSVNAMIVNPLPTPVCLVPPASGGG